VAQHGYLREYDEGPNRSDERDRDWNDRDRERSWRSSERDWSDREQRFMFDQDRDRGPDRDHDRGFFDRMGDRSRSWFRDDDRQYGAGQRDEGRERGLGGSRGDFGRGREDQSRFGSRRDWEGSPRNFSSRQDDHYLSWRNKQMEALDEDYATYCRERENQFHSDFDNWRRNRKFEPGASRGGNEAGDRTGEAAPLELTQERAVGATDNVSSPMDAATLGTNNSENSGRGRR
jgi:hypothetical protein